MYNLEIRIALLEHKKWLVNKETGKRLTLENLDLSNFNFSNFDLSKAVFKNCSFNNSDLRNNSLFLTSFTDCNLTGTKFSNISIPLDLLRGSKL